MTTSIKRIGILTGGGDCPGLNAAIRGIGKAALFQNGIDVVGIRDGYQGLIENRVQALGNDELSGILTRGGTILGTNNRCAQLPRGGFLSHVRRHELGQREVEVSITLINC